MEPWGYGLLRIQNTSPRRSHQSWPRWRTAFYGRLAPIARLDAGVRLGERISARTDTFLEICQRKGRASDSADCCVYAPAAITACIRLIRRCTFRSVDVRPQPSQWISAAAVSPDGAAATRAIPGEASRLRIGELSSSPRDGGRAGHARPLPVNVRMASAGSGGSRFSLGSFP